MDGLRFDVPGVGPVQVWVGQTSLALGARIGCILPCGNIYLLVPEGGRTGWAVPVTMVRQVHRS